MECAPTKIGHNRTIILECHGRVWLVTAEVEQARKQNKENSELRNMSLWTLVEPDTF